MGFQAGQFATTSDNSLFVGYSAGQGITGVKLTGNANTAIGHESGLLLQGTATHNTFLGRRSGDAVTTGTYNTIIGDESDPSSATGTNQSTLGYGVTGVADNSVTLGNSSVTNLYVAPGGANQTIVFRDSADQGKIHYDHGNEMFRIFVGGAEHTKFSNDGDLILLHGGVNFLDAEGTSASSDANTLDDYEEGDYDATATCSTSGTITLEGAYNRLAYVKVGRSVTVTGLLIVNAVSSPSGFINISLPFAIGDGTDKSKSCSGAVQIQGANGILSRDFVNLGVEGESAMRVYVGDASGLQSDSAEGIIANTQLYIGITYQV